MPPIQPSEPPRADGRATLVYDGECPRCLASIDVVRRWDRAGRVRPVPFQDAVDWTGTPGLTRGALESAVHLVGADGRVHVGAAAIREVLSLLPGGRVLAAPLGAPGVRGLAAAAYRWVAGHRRRIRGARASSAD